MSLCNGCQKTIFWVRTVNGKNMPLDIIPNAEGNIVIDPRTGLARVLGRDEPFEHGLRYMSHHATCPKAADFRKKVRDD